MSFDLDNTHEIDWSNESEVRSLYYALLKRHRQYLKHAIIDSKHNPYQDFITPAITKIRGLREAFVQLEELDEEITLAGKDAQ